MNTAPQCVIVAMGLFGVSMGINAAYEKYHGSELSRVPSSQPYLASANAQPATSNPDSGNVSASNSQQDTKVPAPQQIRPASLAPDFEGLTLYPTINKGIRTPFDLWRFYGRGASSYASPVLPMRWEQWAGFHAKQKPGLMQDIYDYMASRFNFNKASIPNAHMSGGKPVMLGPVARLKDSVASFEDLGSLPAAEIRKRDLFPYKPLAHPLQSTAHMVFPQSWIAAHPQHARIDVDHDFPDAYLPEFPPPMFLTTHLELGDVTNGTEVTIDNYYEIFDGLLTPEQMEGLKELLRPSPTTWFNQTTHRVTTAPSKGVACLDCHVNGHTNAAFELGPDSRPNMARLRVDTPTLRGNFNLMQFSSKRSIRSMDHFSEVEEYFDGDPGMQQAIGPRAVKREVSNRMADFNAILDNPPAPKLDPLMQLDPALANASELRGEKLFQGKARCATCHYGPAFVDDYMHDLKAERFYVGRPEGPIKTFPLRGIKDSPPYLHDGRCPTLHDAVEFFNIVLQTKLTKQEKDDLVAYLLCL
ncbi:MAG: cytochrome C [Verrucomicrobiae bacterium]|nr:cytochrome C [Verrucomicrobiae bacterium]